MANHTEPSLPKEASPRKGHFTEGGGHSNYLRYSCVECGDRFPHVEEARLCARIDKLERKSLTRLFDNGGVTHGR